MITIWDYTITIQDYDLGLHDHHGLVLRFEDLVLGFGCRV